MNISYLIYERIPELGELGDWPTAWHKSRRWAITASSCRRPWLRERRIPAMAYSPLEQARLLRDSELIAFARQHGMTPAQAALAWLLAQDDLIVIPKTAGRTHQNIAKSAVLSLSCPVSEV